VFLTNEDTFAAVVGEKWGPKYAERGVEFDPTPYRDAYPLLNDPPAIQEVIVNHLRFMWEAHLKPEWERNLPVLQESVEAFREIDFSGQTALEAIRAVTGRDLTAVWDELTQPRRSSSFRRCTLPVCDHLS
jgi:hypothetical protein